MSDCINIYKAILIFGPTAVGKTALLQHFINHDPPIEVISADSRQIYKACNIVTAYPSEHILTHIPHHLVGIKHYTEAYNVYDFVRDATERIREIQSRGHYPLIIGGAAFYLYHLWQGLPQTPPSDSAIRNALQRELQEHGQEHMFSQLRQIDPIYAANISNTDPYRTLRALEVYRQTGKALSQFSTHTQAPDNTEFLVYGLTREREELYNRINARVDMMFEQGLVEEVHALWHDGISTKYNAGEL